MKKSIVKIAYVAMLLTGVAFTSCSGDDAPAPKPTPVEPTTIAVTGVTLNQSTIIKNQGDKSEQITATILPANATNKNVSWASSDSSTASVDSEGKITLHKGGTVKITVTTQDGSHKAECTLHIIQDGLTIANNKTVINMDNDKIPTDGHVALPDFVTEIGAQAFFECDKLKTVKLPNSLEVIKSSAFSKTGLKEVEIPDSVTKMGTYVFFECNSLTSAKLSKSMTKIPAGTFNSCASLTSVTIPNSVTVIDPRAFKETTSLKSITLPEKLTRIGHDAFSRSGLTSIKLPATLVDIGSNAFYCKHLATVYCYATKPTPITGGLIVGVVKKVYVPTNSLSAYKWGAWGRFANVMIGM